MSQPSNQARTIDELIALLQTAKSVHGGDTLVLTTDKGTFLAGPPSVQFSVALPLRVESDSGVQHRWRAENGYKSLRYGWNHDRHSSDSGQGVDPLEQELKYTPEARVALLLF